MVCAMSLPTKRCADPPQACGQPKPLIAFYGHPTSSDGLDKLCRDCRRHVNRLYKANLAKRLPKGYRRGLEI